MPLLDCNQDGKPGYKWGPAGTCYTYPAGNTAAAATAKRKAMQQAVAISYSQKRAGKPTDVPVK